MALILITVLGGILLTEKEKGIEEFLKDLQSPDAATRENAASLLHNYDEFADRVVPALIGALAQQCFKYDDETNTSMAQSRSVY